MFSIDLKDAYFQISIHPDSRPCIWFVLEGQVFQFRALCFSLSTRVFSLILEWVHRQGVHLLQYLDNWLIVTKSLPLLLCHRDLLLQLCRHLGVVINWEELDLQLSTRLQYLGTVIDFSQERVFPSEARMSQFWDLAAGFLALPSPPARMWQQLLGQKASLEPFLPGGHSRMRPLQWQLKELWFPMLDAPSLLVPLSPECAEAVCWWLQEERWVAGVPLQVPPPSLFLHIDASLLGWGPISMI